MELTTGMTLPRRPHRHGHSLSEEFRLLRPSLHLRTTHGGAGMAADDTGLQQQVRSVLDRNLCMLLCTTGEDGRPRVTPVYFAQHAYRQLYWVSDPTSSHP